MQNSNNNINSLSFFRLILVGALFISAACVKPDRNQYEGGSNFYMSDQSFVESDYILPTRSTVKNKKSISAETSRRSSYWKYPKAIKYTFHVCLKDDLQRTYIINQKFRIHINQGSIVQATEDNGCLSWNETFPFNYFKDAQFLLLERKIEALGTYSGSIPVDIVLNPWARRDNTHIRALYTKFDNKTVILKKAVKGEKNISKALLGDGQVKNIHLDSFRSKLVKDGINNSHKFKFSVSNADIYIVKKDVIGKESKFYLSKGGKYMVQARLYERHSTTGKMVSIDSILEKKAPIVIVSSNHVGKNKGVFQHISSGSLRVSFSKKLYKNWKRGYFTIVLSISPLDEPYGFLNSYTGIFDGGLVHGLAGSSRVVSFMPSLTQEFIEKDKMSQYLNYSAKGSARKDKFEAYYASTMSPKFLQVVKGETSTARSINYTVKTCLTNPATAQPANFREAFNITVTNRFNGRVEKFLTKANHKGCISWVGEIYHKIFLPERLFDFDVNIKELSSGISNKEELGYSINPWGDNLVFGTDRFEISDRYRKSNNERENIRSRFFIPDFTYQTLRFRYEIDKFLRLKVKKTVLMNLKPNILRYNSRTLGRYATYPARDGIYLLKTAMDKHYIDPSQKNIEIIHNGKGTGKEGRHKFKFYGNADLRKRHHLSVNKKLVRVLNGQIITPIEYDASDIRTMRIRAQFVVQLDAIDEQRLWLVNYYNKFYEWALKRSIKEKKMTDVEAEKLRITEKVKNLYRIARVMQRDDFFIENYLIQKSQNLELKKHGTYKGKVYEYCNGEIEVNWKDLLVHFGIKHPYLERYSSGDLSKEHEKQYSDRLVQIHSFQKTKTENKKCLKPFNILRSLQLNEIVANDISPIKGFDLNELIDSSMGYENDRTNKVPREAFTGPVTFLVNGNSSSMRTTRNLSEKLCGEIPDCDEESLNNLPNIGDGFLTKEDIEHYKDIQNNKNYGYEVSKYFNSLQYLNNQLVDDLIKSNEFDKEIYKRKMIVQSQLYYYLSQNNLRFLSTEDEKIFRVNGEKCPDILVPKDFEKECLKEENGLNVLGPQREIFKDVLSDLEEYTHKIFGNRINADEIEIEIVNVKSSIFQRVFDWFRSEKKSKSSLAMSEPLAESTCKYFFQKIVSSTDISALDSYYKECVDQLVSGRRKGILDLERKLRVEKIGKYFYKGGKSININLGASFNYNYQKSFGDTASYGGKISSDVGFKFFGTGVGAGISTDRRWDYNESEARGNGLTIGNSTFLVMQDAQIDLMVRIYRPCITIGYNRAFIEDERVINQITEAVGEDASTTRFLIFSKKPKESSPLGLMSDAKSGLLVCGGLIEGRGLPIRENYYYFTQHFTEGDILDPGDILNHPWLLMIRGKSDMWRFIDKIKAQPTIERESAEDTKKEKDWISNAFNKAQIFFDIDGPSIPEYFWPLRKLVDAYESIYPSYPGIYTMLHLQDPKDFPWDDSPQDSFNSQWGSLDQVELPLRSNIAKQLKADQNKVIDIMGCSIDFGKDFITEKDISSCTPPPIDKGIIFMDGNYRTRKGMESLCPEGPCSEVYPGDAKLLTK